jgi:outer membrane protein W
VAPYVGAGGGAVYYSFRQVGSFVDFVDLSIFDSTFESDGWTPLGMVMAGVDYSVSPHVVLNIDGRYQFATASLHNDFTDFDDGIDLSGLQLSFGVHFRL